MEKWRALVILALSLEITFLGAVSAIMDVTKEKSFGFDMAIMSLGGALAATLMIKDSGAVRKE